MKTPIKIMRPFPELRNALKTSPPRSYYRPREEATFHDSFVSLPPVTHVVPSLLSARFRSPHNLLQRTVTPQRGHRCHLSPPLHEVSLLNHLLFNIQAPVPVPIPAICILCQYSDHGHPIKTCLLSQIHHCHPRRPASHYSLRFPAVARCHRSAYHLIRDLVWAVLLNRLFEPLSPRSHHRAPRIALRTDETFHSEA